MALNTALTWRRRTTAAAPIVPRTEATPEPAGALDPRDALHVLPVAQFCRRELARVDAQIRLLNTVWLWYVAPTIVGLELMTLERWGCPTRKQVLVMLVILAVGVVIHFLNVLTARDQLMPLRSDLEQRIAELSE